jgi:DnaJ-class molecular chaperone
MLSAARTLEEAMREKEKEDMPRKPKQANARKAAKLARKMAKNEFMYREAGQRPWAPLFVGFRAGKTVIKLNDFDSMAHGWISYPINGRSHIDVEEYRARAEHIRKLEGFKQMSALANHFQTHDVTNVLNCYQCDGRGKWKDDAGAHVCLRCNGKGRIVFVRPQWLKHVIAADRCEV